MDELLRRLQDDTENFAREINFDALNDTMRQSPAPVSEEVIKGPISLPDRRNEFKNFYDPKNFTQRNFAHEINERSKKIPEAKDEDTNNRILDTKYETSVIHKKERNSKHNPSDIIHKTQLLEGGLFRKKKNDLQNNIKQFEILFSRI